MIKEDRLCIKEEKVSIAGGTFCGSEERFSIEEGTLLIKEETM